MKSWAGPENEATITVHSKPFNTLQIVKKAYKSALFIHHGPMTHGE